ncbi:hypothetical protein J4Q44_G00193160 [Coregonus suidteri]|uniref:Nucleoporin NDC1 n=1 Tax=Coregonus suidteri TaxID=861788 RepID=A0AAN8LV67_9TELE
MLSRRTYVSATPTLKTNQMLFSSPLLCPAPRDQPDIETTHALAYCLFFHPPTPGQSVVNVALVDGARHDVPDVLNWIQVWGTGGPVHSINAFLLQELLIQSSHMRHMHICGLLEVILQGSGSAPPAPPCTKAEVAVLLLGCCPPTASSTSPDVLACYTNASQPRGCCLSNLVVPARTPHLEFQVSGSLWNCRSATNKAEFISAYATLQASDKILRLVTAGRPTTCPLDPIPSSLLQTISGDLLPYLTSLINSSLTAGYVPFRLQESETGAFSGAAHSWIASYLTGRSYQVAWREAVSAPRALTTGVPQGSSAKSLGVTLDNTLSVSSNIKAHSSRSAQPKLFAALAPQWLCRSLPRPGDPWAAHNWSSVVQECLSLLTSASTIFSFILLCGVVLLVGFFNLEYYTVVPSIACSKIDLLGQVLHPRQFVHSLAHCIMGVVVAWCCAFTIGGRYRALGHPCTQDESSSGPEMCLNEYHLVLLLVGAFIGYSHSLLGVVHNINYVSFHTMRQYKYLRFKGTLPLVVKASAVQALYSLRNFLLLYFFLGYAPRAWICKTLDLNINRELTQISLYYYSAPFSTPLLLGSSPTHPFYQSSLVTVLLWTDSLLLYQSPTHCFSAVLDSRFSYSEDAHQCLPKVITGMQPMILKFLALQDLALLSQHSPSRRLEVFSLSQPGGHPHIWTALSKECLSLLSDLTERLVVYHDAVATNGRAKSQSTGSNKRSAATSSESSVSSVDMEDMKTPRPSALIRTPGSVFLRSSVGAGLGGLRTPLTAPFTPDLDSPFSSPALRRLAGPLEPLGPLSPGFNSIQSPHVMRRGPKLWSASTDSQLNSSPTPSPGPAPTQADLKPSFLVAFLQNRKDQVKNFLAKRVLIMYLFNKLPEASSQALFADSQAHIWALEGLSHLVAASYSEDQYGIVQTTLPTILSTMLVLQEAVDRHFKLPHTSSKPGHSSCSMGDGSYKTLRFALRSTLKTAVYRITATFGEHLHAVQMSAEHRKKLQHFLEYKE